MRTMHILKPSGQWIAVQLPDRKLESDEVIDAIVEQYGAGAVPLAWWDRANC